VNPVKQRVPRTVVALPGLVDETHGVFERMFDHSAVTLAHGCDSTPVVLGAPLDWQAYAIVTTCRGSRALRFGGSCSQREAVCRDRCESAPP
jgi:hypothetical protein